jgi:hypothetical protein
MALQDLLFEMSGEMNIPANLAITKLNEALGQIYDDGAQQMWSFQIREADNWLTPGLLFATGGPGALQGHDEGLITATPYSNEIVGDALATASWNAYGPFTRPFFSELQIRSPFFSLYNIIHYDFAQGDHAPLGTITLDRPWMEPNFPAPGQPQPYMIYQAYFPTPTQDFKRFLEIRDTQNSSFIDYWTYSQRDLSLRDPQRVIFDLPTYAVFRGWDQRGAGTDFASATLGYPLYELWPHPLSVSPYTFSSLRRGPMLQNLTDTIPAPLTEDMLKWKTREALYLFKESQKGEQVQRGSGADWHYLAEAAAAEYNAARDRIGKRDVAIVDLFLSRFYRGAAERGAPFATINQQLNVGGL